MALSPYWVTAWPILSNVIFLFNIQYQIFWFNLIWFSWPQIRLFTWTCKELIRDQWQCPLWYTLHVQGRHILIFDYFLLFLHQILFIIIYTCTCSTEESFWFFCPYLLHHFFFCYNSSFNIKLFDLICFTWPIKKKCYMYLFVNNQGTNGFKASLRD